MHSEVCCEDLVRKVSSQLPIYVLKAWLQSPNRSGIRNVESELKDRSSEVSEYRKSSCWCRNNKYFIGERGRGEFGVPTTKGTETQMIRDGVTRLRVRGRVRGRGRGGRSD
jgi:hypothetical protein